MSEDKIDSMENIFVRLSVCPTIVKLFYNMFIVILSQKEQQGNSESVGLGHGVLKLGSWSPKAWNSEGLKSTKIGQLRLP